MSGNRAQVKAAKIIDQVARWFNRRDVPPTTSSRSYGFGLLPPEIVGLSHTEPRGTRRAIAVDPAAFFGARRLDAAFLFTAGKQAGYRTAVIGKWSLGIRRK